MFRTLTTAGVIALGLGAAPAAAATFQGEFWDVGAIGTLDEALAVIASRGADQTFRSGGIDYSQGADKTVDSGKSVGFFLGADAATLSGGHHTNIVGSVFRFTGFVDLGAGDETFAVGSDDGFRLTVGGVELGRADLREFSTSTFVTDAGDGPTAVELIYFQNHGLAGVEFSVNGQIAVATDDTVGQVAPVPLPAGLPLLAGALGAFAFARRRKA